MDDEEGNGEWDFYVTSMYGMKNQQALVSIKLHDIAVQVPPAKAREMAMMLLEAAEGAEGDAFIIHFFQKIGMNDEECAKALLLFREEREKRA